ncbi:DNA gyrase inhibitor YacG [Roseococcus sp. SDR]|uniref:DNA gyrase inhibitor YacG n=1 Tax=Roseococcus sp. SDR TaxID=2835532 RepID=UPI001BCFA838|nr:DNA gyrase inhibitor YacG [Roseococcus sp. SDR]MBS7788598.1 DNA gyrase inhibitor YacG [Roseococcus sp. SDR]MBV1843912.1 DNA gyrase inhibitor YacG [Roseococcus sp. SDR]
MPEPRCPICRRLLPPREPGQRHARPFCSERCRQVDLGRWLTESYSVPAVDPEDQEEER